MKEDILKLTKQLMVIPSTADNHQGLFEALELVQKELGRNFTTEHFESDGFKSLLVHNSTHRTRHFKIILNAHLDVVQADKKYFTPIERNGRLYGRGSYDMKAATVVMMEVFKKVATTVSYPIGLQITTDEEVGGLNGTKHQITKGIRTDFAITGDCGTNLNIVNKSKGVMGLVLSAKGLKSHGAYLWRGENALWKIHNSLAALHKEFPTPKEEVWTSTMNLAKIDTNNDYKTIVPDHATVSLDFRFIPEDEHTILDKIIQTISPDIDVEVIYKEAAENTPATNRYAKLLKKTTEKITGKDISFISAHGTSDIRHFKTVDCAGVEFGPIGSRQHADDEWVDIKSLEEYYQVLEEFLLSVK